MSSKYIIYGGELSYFTRKLEAALYFYDVDFETRSKNKENPAEIESRSGTHQVPVLQTPENWMIGDTTPLMHLMDSRIPERRMFPEGPIGILVHTLEEYFDEWIARTMVHYRWHYPESAEFASLKMADGIPEIAARVRAWGPRACRATGTESETQRKAAEDEYLRILNAMEKQLAETTYMLGDRPTAVDCILLGGLLAHTNMDPDPKKVTAKFSRVVNWAETATSGWAGDGSILPFPDSTPFAQFVLAEMALTYQPYILSNKAAQEAGAKAFHTEIYGEDVSYLSRPYPERSRQMIVNKIQNNLTSDERGRVQAWLHSVDLDKCFID